MKHKYLPHSITLLEPYHKNPTRDHSTLSNNYTRTTVIAKEIPRNQETSRATILSQQQGTTAPGFIHISATQLEAQNPHALPMESYGNNRPKSLST